MAVQLSCAASSYHDGTHSRCMVQVYSALIVGGMPECMQRGSNCMQQAAQLKQEQQCWTWTTKVHGPPHVNRPHKPAVLLICWACFCCCPVGGLHQLSIKQMTQFMQTDERRRPPGEMACTARVTALSTCSATEHAAAVMRWEASGLNTDSGL